MPTPNQALSLLWQAARLSPPLREAVETVEIKIARLESLLDDAFNGCSPEWITEQRTLIDGSGDCLLTRMEEAHNDGSIAAERLAE